MRFVQLWMISCRMNNYRLVIKKIDMISKNPKNNINLKKNQCCQWKTKSVFLKINVGKKKTTSIFWYTDDVFWKKYWFLIKRWYFNMVNLVSTSVKKVTNFKESLDDPWTNKTSTSCNTHSSFAFFHLAFCEFSLALLTAMYALVRWTTKDIEKWRLWTSFFSSYIGKWHPWTVSFFMPMFSL